MAKYRNFNPLDPLPADFLDALNEFISTLAVGFFVQIKSTDATVLQVFADTGNNRACIAIEGRWRYNTATVERASPGGVARALDVYATGTDNVFVPGDPGEIDNTDYSFGLSIVESGALPVGVAIKRLVATAVWSGSQFTSVQQFTTRGVLRSGDQASGELSGNWPNPIIGALAASRVLIWGGDTSLSRRNVGSLGTPGSFSADGGLNTLGGLQLLADGTLIVRSKAAANGAVLVARVAGDANDRLFLRTDGQLLLGDGTNAPDTNLYRAAAGNLKTDGRLVVGSQLTLFPAAFGIQSIAALTDHLLRNFLTIGDTQPTFRIAGSGRLEFGIGGSTPADTNLYRPKANTLQTDDSLVVGGGLTVVGDQVGGAHATLSARPVLDVGVLNQIRAGRVLAAADFPKLPVGLFNLAGLTNLGSGGTLVNKGSVAFGTGITGAAAEAAVFAGSTGQALYIADTGSADSFRIVTGSWGCWFRSAKLATNQFLLGKCSPSILAATSAFYLGINGPSNTLSAFVCNGSTGASLAGVTPVIDNRWHLAVVTYDGTDLRLYLDGELEVSMSTSIGPMNSAASAPLNVGAVGADASTGAASPLFGRVDEAFVTPEVLSDDEARILYCAAIPHGYSLTPTRAQLAVRRLRRGGPLAIGDFPSQPLRLHNFTAAAALLDEGANGQALVNNGGAVLVAGADGARSGAFSFVSGSSQWLASTDSGLPSGTAATTMGCWLKTTQARSAALLTYGTAFRGLMLNASGAAELDDNGELRLTGATPINDGLWHFVVGVFDPAPSDGLPFKLYVDSELVGSASTALSPVTLGGAGAFQISRGLIGAFLTGQLDGVFVHGSALAASQIAQLYAKGSVALTPSPKDAGAHIEAFDATNVYAIFDTLESQDQVDVAVAA